MLKERPLATRLGWLLRKNLLLILQLLAAIVLIAALADPSLTSFGAPAGDTVVVMDLTASMKAKGPGGTRFDAARRELLSLVDGLPAERRDDGDRRGFRNPPDRAFHGGQEAAPGSRRATSADRYFRERKETRCSSPTPF